MRGWLTRSRVRWAPSSLDDLQEVVDRTPLHSDDRASVQIKIGMARHYGGSPECRADLIQLVDSLVDRYRYPIEPEYALVVDQIRSGLPSSQRGRGVGGLFGEFRRGEVVCLPQIVDGDLMILDGVFLEAEPSSDHTRKFGRMGGVQQLCDLSLTRWFLDEIHHGREYGRPW